MGFNKLFLPPIGSLIEKYEKEGLETFVRSFERYDAIMGDSQSVTYLETLMETYRKKNL